MFIEEKMIDKIEEYIEMANKKEEEFICYYDKENDNEKISKMLFKIHRSKFRVIIAKEMNLFVEGFKEKQKIIFLMNEKEKIIKVSNMIEEWKEDFIPLLTKKKIEELEKEKIIIMLEKEYLYLEMKTGMYIENKKIAYITEKEKMEEIKKFRKVKGVSLESYKASLKEEIIKNAYANEVIKLVM